MKINKKISVVMSVYNETVDMVKASIESILSQTYSNIEIIVVVDNPENKELLIYLEKIKRDVILIINEKNIGLAESLNKGIKNSSGSVIARMDADDVSKKDRLEMQYDFMIKGGYDFVSSGAELIDESGETLNETIYPPQDILEFKRKIKHSNCLIHPTFMFTKKMFDSIGGYKNLKAAQDYELVRRIYKYKYNMGFNKNIVLQYRIRKSSITSKNKVWQYYIMDATRHSYNKKKDLSEEFVKKCKDNNNLEFLEYQKDFEEYILSNEAKNPFFVKIKLLLRSKWIRRHVYHIFCRKILMLS